MLRPHGRLELDAARLRRDHPPRIRDPQKRAIFDLSGGEARIPRGTLVVTRWLPGDGNDATRPSVRVGPQVSTAGVDGPFTYPRAEEGVVAWHVNFADTHLFAFYGGPAFAQDEIQVAEHPLLASVRELLVSGAADIPPLTRDRDRPTPVLVRGVERWCAIDTDPELAQPYGIYGRRLGRASVDALRQAVTRLDDAPPSNILAIVAPQGAGQYSADDLRDIMVTATTGFAAAKLESAGARVRIHTGHWGTGAFGGNRVLMVAAQLAAARIARVDDVAYHSLDEDGVRAYEQGRAIANGYDEGASIEDVVADLDARGFRWGSSDGN